MKRSYFIAFVLVLISFSVYGDWPQFQKDCKHTGAEPDETINLPLCIKQTYPIVMNTGAQRGIGLIDSSGGMYFNESYSVRKLDLTTGHFLWTTSTGGSSIIQPIIAAPGVICNNTVIFEYSKGFVCLDSATGSLLWQKAVTGMTGVFNYASGVFGNLSFPTLANGNIYCGSSTGEIAVINAATGDTLHLFRVATSAILSAPAVDDDGSLYFGCVNADFYCINGSTGAPKWSYNTGTNIMSTASVDSTGVYCTNSLGKVFKLDKSNGALLWANRCGSFNEGSGALYGDSYYIGSDDRSLYRFNKDTGAIIWSTYCTDNFANMSCIAVGNKIFIAGCINQLVIIDSITGSQIYSCLTFNSNFSNLSYWNKNIVFTSYDGRLYIVGECGDACGSCTCNSSLFIPTKVCSPTITTSITFTPTVSVTSTFSPTLTITASLTPSFTSTTTDTFTPTSTVTFTPTATSSSTPTFTPSATYTCSASPTFTPTATETFTPAPTFTCTKTPLPCDGVTKPSFAVSVNYPAGENYVEVDIKSTSLLPDPPSIVICTSGSAPSSSASGVLRAQCHDSDCATYTAAPSSDDEKSFVLKYPKSNPGNFGSITASGTDYCGISGKSDGTFISVSRNDRDVSVLKNVINPDNGEKTTLQCKISCNGNITAKVYSRTGSLVKTICSNEARTKGDCDIYWDGTNNSGAKVASGIYSIVINTGNYDDIEKVCVLR